MENKLENGKVYFPIGKTVLGSGAIESFIMFEATEEKFVPIRGMILRNGIRNGYDIRGFSGRTINTNSYFKRVRDIEETEGTKPQWLVYRKDIIKRETRYRLVSEEGEKKVLTRAELNKFLDDGNVVLGTLKAEPCKKNPSGWRVTADLIISVNGDEPNTSNGRLKKLPTPEEIDEKIKRETGVVLK